MLHSVRSYYDSGPTLVERYLFVSAPSMKGVPTDYAIIVAHLGDGEDKSHTVEGIIVELTLHKETTHAMKQVP